MFASEPYGNSFMNGPRTHQVYPRDLVLALCDFGGRQPEREQRDSANHTKSQHPVGARQAGRGMTPEDIERLLLALLSRLMVNLTGDRDHDDQIVQEFCCKLGLPYRDIRVMTFVHPPTAALN
jgi:hypothetical protein